MSQRGKVIALYKQLVYLGREYPLGYEEFFRPRLKAAFLKKRDLKDTEEIDKAIRMGEYIVKGNFLLLLSIPTWLRVANEQRLELEAMYFLRKYRAMKQRYAPPE
ncbi:hypothetical protein BZG36_05676 [Bifiguratus adelaidae]|uniref:Complex 1 LYR protein domain-containing protein n=1 Tax=Bifiguratus adelaidae TaxID=1938954 RepID=A0A261XSS9_9FUNG|nr:hypothetical protein BZG36_05676 [Bifiguratus adelaidae]